VLLVDDHQILRHGLRLSLRQEPDLEVVGEAGEGSTALRLATELRPDVIVMDISLPDADGVELARRILAARPETRIVILTGLVEREHLDRALAAGINNFVLKVDATNQLITALRKARRNEAYVSPAIAAAMVGKYQELLAASRRNERSALSEREETVLKLIADGRSIKEIAGDLRLSIKTVEGRRRGIMAKLDLGGVADLTKYAIRNGLTSL
jgi:DNA-binding NarL/FixJ family response regulator